MKLVRSKLSARNGQLLAGVAEEHFLVGVEAAQTHGVHVDAVDHLAA